MKQPYRPEIDGLRTVAVGAVIISHMGYPFSEYLPGGFIGVDIFFVISGFLITSIIYRELQADQFTFWGFYERRARRILPALLLVCAASFPFAWVLMSPDQFTGYSQSLVGIGLFASNFYFWLTSDYFAPNAEELVMIHTWSLAVEEQFYVFFPLLFLFLWRRQWVLAGFTLVFAASLILAETLGRVAPHAGFYLVVTRVWELILGSLAGYCVARFGLPDGQVGPVVWRGIGRIRRPLAACAILGLSLSLAFYHHGLVVPGVLFLLPVGSTATLLICVHGSGVLYRVLAAPPMVWIGLLSYSMYLWHQPVFAFLRVSQLSVPSPIQMIGALTGVFLLAWMTRLLVEQPLRRVKRGRLGVLAGLVVAIAALMGVGFSGHVNDGFAPLRFAEPTLQTLAQARPSPKRRACHSKPPQDACHYHSEFPVGAAVLGDSHAVELAYTFANQMASFDIGTVHLTRSSCPPALIFETNRGGCSDWLNASTQLLESAEPGIVLLAYRHASYLYGQNETARPPFPALPDTPFSIEVDGTKQDKRNAYWASFETLIDRLMAAGHQVVVVVPFPEIVFHVERYVLRGIPEISASGAISVTSVPRDYYDERVAQVQTRLAQIAAARPDLIVHDPAYAFCDKVTCYAMRAGVPLYFDDDHPSLAGADLVAAGILRDLERAK